MITLEHALERILAVIPPARIETVPLAEATGRLVQANFHATLDLPPFDNSAMDGYAVLAADVQRATRDHPVRLRLHDRIPAGEIPHARVTSGLCTRVFTGSPLPPGADAVVMQEDADPDPVHPDQVCLMESVKPWENVRVRGEDIRQGTTVAEQGARVTPGLTALLAALGLSEVAVGQQPTVGLLATGNELREAGSPLAPGQIYESNRTALSSLCRRAGGQPRSYPLVADEMKATRSALERALQECDLVVTSGGVSVGELDLVKEAFSTLGGQLDFWRVAIKPGRPFVFGQWQDKCLFGLPGNPVSAVVTFLLLVRPAMLKWQGGTDLSLPTHTGTLATPFRNSGDRRHFMRVRVDHQGQVHSTGGQSSHMLQSLALSNGLVDVPPNSELPIGATVPVLRWDLA